LLVVG